MSGRRTLRRRAGIALLALSVAAMVLASAASFHAPETVRGEVHPLTTAGLPDIALPQGPVRVNQAELAELTTLPGIGETIGRRIIEERAAHGPFRYPEDLTAVKGIGPKLVEGLREQLNLEVGDE